MALAILLALLPLVELVDHWESYGSDPEFVSVITVLGICLGFLLLFGRHIAKALHRLVPVQFALSELSPLGVSMFPTISASPPELRVPIRI